MTEARPAWMALSAIVTALLVLIGGPAVANDVTAWQMDLVTPASPVMEEIKGLYDYLTWIAIAIVLFVLALLAYVCIRFSAARNPEPSKTSHNTLLEVVWTAIPVVILATIAVPSLKLLYFMDKTHEADMTLKVIGHQWYWSYEYPDHGDFVFDAFMLYKEDLEENQPRLLTTDNAVVLPVDTNIRVLTTSTDVIHSWALPSMGVKTDSVPGGPMKPGSASPSPASITANARNFVGSTTALCQSPSRPCRKRNSPPGSKRRRSNSPALMTRTTAAKKKTRNWHFHLTRKGPRNEYGTSLHRISHPRRPLAHRLAALALFDQS